MEVVNSLVNVPGMAGPIVPVPRPSGASPPTPAAPPPVAGAEGSRADQGKEAPPTGVNLKSSTADSSVPKDPTAEAGDVIGRFLDNLKGPDTVLNIDVDKKTGRFVYRTVDRETGEVTRQFPSEEVLRRVAAFRDVQGLVYDDKA